MPLLEVIIGIYRWDKNEIDFLLAITDWIPSSLPSKLNYNIQLLTQHTTYAVDSYNDG